MDAFKPFIAKVATGAPLTQDEARAAFETLLSGEVTPAQGGAFLMALRVRGETVDEIAGAASALRARMIKVKAPSGAIDIVGTGGDSVGTYNISTLTALVVAACGVCVAKHGNRAASSKSGAADVLTALGINIGVDAETIGGCLDEAGIGFMFAPNHHASMRHVGPVRTELGTRTIFNLIGPLANPASVKRQLLGAFSQHWLEPMVEVLKTLGSEKVWAVHGSDGLDEITTTGPTQVVALENGQIRKFTISPEDVGLPRASVDELKGGDPEHNAQALKRVLQGERGAYRDIVIINAAAALVVADKATDLADGAEQAAGALDRGDAFTTLNRLISLSNHGSGA